VYVKRDLTGVNRREEDPKDPKDPKDPGGDVHPRKDVLLRREGEGDVTGWVV
tara:strand:- start:30 stop:185 length:156 start_codon:yes stop_codon:yes gene_type:complete